MRIDTIYEKGIGKMNEDALLKVNPIFGVFDGASGLEPYENTQGQTGAAIASSTASNIFSKSNRSLFETARVANVAIGNAMHESGIDASRKTAQWNTTGAVVKINGDTFDWLQIGDSLILTVFYNRTFQLLVRDYDHDLETLIMWHELASHRTEDIRNILNNQILKVRNEMNVNYGAFNGETEMEKFLKHGTVTLDNIAHIVLFTDGLFLPKENPHQPDDFKTFVDLFLEGGLKKVRDYVREQESSDPECWKYPRFKLHDDIAAVALSF